MDGRQTPGPLSLLDLVESPRWQSLQDHFARVLGVTIRTVDSSRHLLVNPSWPFGLIPEQVIRLLSVGEELEALIPADRPPQETSSLTMPVGITYAVVPIRATSERVTACFVIGPMMVGTREDELQFRQRVGLLGLDASVLWPLMLSLKLYTFGGVRAALNLLEEVGTAVVQLAYQVKQLAAILPQTSKVDQAVVTYHANRILHALLDAATLATKAEGGSVMVYDPQRDTLQIKASQGLSDAVVAATRLKRGEGLAGFAMAQESILLIDDKTKDERIRSRMTRRELASSLVASFSTDPQQGPIGVLNLRTSNPQRHFTQEHVELLRRLLDLTGAALSSLRFAFTPSSPPSAPQPS